MQKRQTVLNRVANSLIQEFGSFNEQQALSLAVQGFNSRVNVGRVPGSGAFTTNPTLLDDSCNGAQRIICQNTGSFRTITGL